jgi:EpsI family protein
MKGIPTQNVKTMASISIVILAIVFLHWESFRWLYSQWTTDKAYLHGFLVPLVSLYLVWCKKDFLLSIPLKPSRLLGYFAICLCFLALLVGRIGAVVQIEALSFFLMIPSCLLLLFGWQHLKALLVPIFYLQFMIPWMDPILEKLHRPFQLISATISTALLGLKYPVYSDDLFIYLPNISMVVAQECSGINFLISVIAIGLPLVYLSQKTWFRATSVIIIGCVLAVLSNGLRIAIAGYCGQNYGPNFLHGPSHILQGLFVSWVGWIGIFAVNWLVGKIPFKNGAPEYYLSDRWHRHKTTPFPSSENTDSVHFHISALSLLLFGFTVYINFFAMPRPVALNPPLQQFPAEINGWQGEQSDWIKGQKLFHDLDDNLGRAYHDRSGNIVYLFIGYYQRQDNDNRLVSNLSGALYNHAETVSVSQGQSSFQGVSSFLSSNDENFGTLFWYQFPAQLKMTDRMQIKLHVLESGLLQRQNNGAIILLATPKNICNDGDKKSLNILQSFAADLAPVMSKFLQ